MILCLYKLRIPKKVLSNPTILVSFRKIQVKQRIQNEDLATGSDRGRIEGMADCFVFMITVIPEIYAL